MATVCVGCGLTVVGGVLTLDGGGLCDDPLLGLRCVDDEVDWYMPYIGRRSNGGALNTAFVPVTGFNLAQLTPNYFEFGADAGSNCMSVQVDGTILIEKAGLFSVNLTGGFTKDDAETDLLVGGRARIYRDGTTIVASSGFIDWPISTVSISEGEDGPEFSCSAILALAVGQEISWEVMAVGDAAGITVHFPASVNLFTIVRLGNFAT